MHAGASSHAARVSAVSAESARPPDGRRLSARRPDRSVQGALVGVDLARATNESDDVRGDRVTARREARCAAWRAGALALALATAVLAPTVGAAASARPSDLHLTFSGAVKGTSKDGEARCVETQGAHGKQLSVNLNMFRVGGKRYDLTLSLGGSDYAPGTYDFGDSGTPGSTGVVVQLTAAASDEVWASAEGSGAATLRPGRKSGGLRGDLPAGTGIARTKGAPVHVVGTFRCHSVERFGSSH
jgi:hypothetical protein